MKNTGKWTGKLRTGRQRLVITVGFLLVTALTIGLFVWADSNSDRGPDGPEMQIKMGDITRGSNICMGDITKGYAGPQLKWTVLDPDNDNVGNPGAMFVFSKGVVGEADSKGNAKEFMYYNGWINPIRKLSINNHWHHSSMPKWCDAFARNVFSQPEQNIIRSVTKKEVPTENIGPFKDKVPHVEPDGHWSGYYDYYDYDLLLEPDTIKEQKVFFPSYDEIKKEDAYASMPGYQTTRYWLRSPGQLYPVYELLDLFFADVGIYTTHADHKDYGKTHSPAFEYRDVCQKCLARPVMNIEKGSVIFSNVAGVKEDVTIGEMKELDQDRKGRTDWELSIEDPKRRDFDAKAVAVHRGDGHHNVEVQISGAKTGQNEYISAIAMNGDGDILYYGRVKESTNAEDTVMVPVMWADDDDDIKLYVFSEMYAGREKSSHVSPLRYIDINDPNIAIRVVTFDLNGHGSPQPDWQEVEVGEKATKPMDPFAVGFDFRGWFTGPETEIPWDFDDIVPASMTLYAGWEAHRYTIEYDANGGGGTMADQERYYQDEEPLKECEFTPPEAGMKFTGWNERPDGSGSNHYPGDTDDLTYNEDTHIKLYAQWSEDLMVAYHLNGHGSPQPDSEITNARKGWKIKKPEDPTDKAYDFRGWYTTPGCDQGDPWDFENDILENNTTLFAKWDPHHYTVHFEPNGANRGEMEDQQREIGDNVPIENGFGWDIYTSMRFVEWNTKADGTGRSFENGYTGDLTEKDGEVVTLYAIWANMSYKVGFDKNGGSGDDMQYQYREYNDGKALPENTYTKEGAAFAGWNDKADGTGRYYEDKSKKNIITQDNWVWLYAQWVSRYTVHFDANGGNGRMDDEIRQVGDGKALPKSTFIRESYEFAGWNTERDGSGTAYEDGFVGDLKLRSDEITLYAQWKITYTIHYDGNGATSGSMEDQHRIFGDEGCLTPNAFGREAYVFDSWNTRADGTGIEYADKAEGDLTSREGTITLYAQWKDATVYTVTFDANGGNFEGGISTQTRTTDSYGRLSELEPGPQHPDGYPFCGWYSDPEGGAKVEDGARFAYDTTLYACWTPQKDDIHWDMMDFTGPFTITYDANGGTVDPTQKKTEPGSPNRNKVFVSRHPTPQWEHRGFAGWWTESEGGALTVEGTGGNATQYMSDTTLYAHWRPMEYTVRFNNNGGQGIMPDQHRTYDDGVSLASNTYVRTNYKFNGWNTDKDGFGIPYEDGHVGNMTDKEETVVLYAQWKQNEYIVYFDMSGVEASPRIEPCMTGPEEDYKVEKPAKDPQTRGYTFEGWYKEPECINEWDFDRDIVVDEATTLYAKWIEHGPRVVVFDLNGHGTDAPAPQMRGEMHGYKAEKPGTDPTARGYNFTGWYKEKECINSWDFDNDILQKMMTTLYAGWDPIGYTVSFDANPPEGKPSEGQMDEVTRKYDDGKALPPVGYTITEPNPADEAYTFTGWNTAADGSGDGFGDEDSQNITATDGAEVTLYAQWDIAQITTTNLPDGRQGEPYQATMTQMGLNNASWRIYNEYDGLPEGLSLDSDTGVISGTTDQAGTFKFTVRVDGTNIMGEMETLSKQLSLDILQKTPELLIIEFVEGMNGTWTRGDSSGLNFKTNGPFNMFTGLDIDGNELVEGTDYVASEGSTVINLKPEFLKGLADGSHVLTAYYNDGQKPFTRFAVTTREEPPKPDDRNDNKDKEGNGNGDGQKNRQGSTGDEVQILPWILLLAGSALTAGTVVGLRRRKKDNRAC